MARKGIYCHGELRRIPKSEFRRNPDGSLFEPYIHEPRTGKPHWASNGLPVKKVGSIPQKAAARKMSLGRRAKSARVLGRTTKSSARKAASKK